MSLISFIKEAGEKLFNKPAAAAPTQEAVAELNDKASQAIENYVKQQNLSIEALDVKFDGASGKVVLSGRAPSIEASEKAALCCGNVAHVASVDNMITVANQGPAAKFHDVVSGDTLSAIAKKHYGDAGKYNQIFEANKPMLTDPNKIYPGQKLRIPAG